MQVLARVAFRSRFGPAFLTTEINDATQSGIERIIEQTIEPIIEPILEGGGRSPAGGRPDPGGRAGGWLR